MDQKRLVLAIAISLAITLGFQAFVAPHLPKPPPPAHATSEPATLSPASPGTSGPTVSAPGTSGATQPVPDGMVAQVPKNVPRVEINAPKISGSISLLGARLDDVVLTDYHETTDPASPRVTGCGPRSDDKPYYVQYGWTAPPGETIALPGDDTVWTASETTLSPGHNVTLNWDNGQGLTFQITLGIDDDYMFTVVQSVKNATGQPVKLLPWSRVRRDYKPLTSGYYILHEGMLGFFDGSLKEETYAKAKTDGEKKDGVAQEAAATGGWAGITDKYWLAAMIPDQTVPSRVYFRDIEDKTSINPERFQVDYVTQDPMTAGPEARPNWTRICSWAPKWSGCSTTMRAS